MSSLRGSINSGYGYLIYFWTTPTVVPIFFAIETRAYCYLVPFISYSFTSSMDSSLKNVFPFSLSKIRRGFLIFSSLIGQKNARFNLPIPIHRSVQVSQILVAPWGTCFIHSSFCSRIIAAVRHEVIAKEVSALSILYCTQEIFSF